MFYVLSNSFGFGKWATPISREKSSSAQKERSLQWKHLSVNEKKRFYSQKNPPTQAELIIVPVLAPFYQNKRNSKIPRAKQEMPFKFCRLLENFCPHEQRGGWLSLFDLLGMSSEINPTRPCPWWVGIGGGAYLGQMHFWRRSDTYVLCLEFAAFCALRGARCRGYDGGPNLSTCSPHYWNHWGPWGQRNYGPLDGFSRVQRHALWWRRKKILVLELNFSVGAEWEDTLSETGRETRQQSKCFRRPMFLSFFARH